MISRLATTVRFYQVLFVLTALAVPGLGYCQFVLITKEEAKRPKAFVDERGALPAPLIEVFGPGEDAPVSSPIRFVIKLTSRAGASIVTDSFSAKYMVKDRVDLTERLRPFLRNGEIRVERAIVPPGKHQIYITVMDSDGQRSHKFYTFCVVTCRDDR